MSGGVVSSEEQFRLKEFELIRDEIAKRTEDQVVLERNVAIAIGAIFSIIATLSPGIRPNVSDVLLSKILSDPRFAVSPDPIIFVLWFLPPFILLFGHFRWKANEEQIARLGRCIRDEFPYETWEKYNACARGAPDSSVWWHAMRWGWRLAIVGFTGLAIYMTVDG
ncbi:hypothetical protein L1787_03060 [Acuticoccus sp. M5D2P5]|uniref:hypothetical protein n=1 Tax=Acuticoccus kalidii TaxID=2910977 RepID=UPI001F429B61|nr:hypothetical protein [Acuticoccus kalidii]MCF3932394.1 hypothetical protein [Acuticoccus kalidii]